MLTVILGSQGLPEWQPLFSAGKLLRKIPKLHTWLSKSQVLCGNDVTYLVLADLAIQRVTRFTEAIAVGFINPRAWKGATGLEKPLLPPWATFPPAQLESGLGRGGGMLPGCHP